MRNTAEGLLLTLYVGVPLDVWEAFWVVTAHNDAFFKDAFRALYHLEIVTIEDVETPYDAVQPTDGFLPWWVDATIWLVGGGGACTGGCPQTPRPTP